MSSLDLYIPELLRNAVTDGLSSQKMHFYLKYCMKLISLTSDIRKVGITFFKEVLSFFLTYNFQFLLDITSNNHNLNVFFSLCVLEMLWRSTSDLMFPFFLSEFPVSFKSYRYSCRHDIWSWVPSFLLDLN